MKYVIVLSALLFVGCASQNQSADISENKGPSTVYVQVIGPTGMEITTDMAEPIRDEAYAYYQSLGLTQARSLVDADMTVVFKANEIALRDAVKVSVDKTKMSTGKDIWVTVNGDEGTEINNPIADVIKTQTYAEFASKGYKKATTRESADLKVSVYTNDQTLRAAVRKVLNKQIKPQGQ